jgi:predicted O-methyltransferase YrrM
MGVTPEAIQRLSDELEANRRSRRTAWAMLQRLRKFLQANGARISMPEEVSTITLVTRIPPEDF